LYNNLIGERMIILVVEYENTYYHNLIQKLSRTERRVSIHVDIFVREGVIYIVSLDDGFSVSFVYMAYLKAKERGLDAKLLYARFIDESWLPEEIRKLGEKWVDKKISSKEIETLKKISITEHMLDRWCK